MFIVLPVEIVSVTLLLQLVLLFLYCRYCHYSGVVEIPIVAAVVVTCVCC